jgi:MSHA biogenesis protein MshQ
VTGVGTLAWSNPGNAIAPDGVYTLATATSATGTQLTNYLKCTGYGFTIPSTATINGITVNIVRHISSTNNTSGQDSGVRVVGSTGAIGTTDRSTTTAYTTTDVTEAHGSATDLWGAAWSPANINSANFGVAYSGNITKTSTSATRAINVDVIQISVDYTVPFPCTPPSNVPAGVTVSCQCDNFARASLQPSTIFNSNWQISYSDATGILPQIVNPGYLRLTNNTGNNAKAATVPGIFPAAGNYISVEFQQYAYNGSNPGADGIAVILSDYSMTAAPGAYGGSLGYAQETGIHDGFYGGWLGVGLDEYGNYQSSTEGRLGGLCTTAACMPQSVGARGSGSGQTGYRWLGGSGVLSPTIDNHASTSASYGYFYQVVVDARNDPTSTSIAVNRDTGGGYVPLINIPNVYTAATGQGFIQAPVPTNWQISFTGSTGGSNNIHEIGSLRICASTMVPPSGGSAGSFNAIDEAYGTPPLAVQYYLSGHIYTKLVGTSFKLNVAALSNSQLVTTYAASAAKTVTVKLVDNSDSLTNSALDCTLSCTNTCTGKTAVTGGTQTLTFAAGATDKGQKQSPSFTVNTAYQKLVAIISDGTTSAC